MWGRVCADAVVEVAKGNTALDGEQIFCVQFMIQASEQGGPLKMMTSSRLR